MAVNKKSLDNLKVYRKGQSGNPRGRPPGKKPQESQSYLRELVSLEVDDEIASILPDSIKPEFLAKVKREKWPLEKLMDFYAIMGSLSGQQSGYSYYREIKDRLYGKSESEKETSDKRGPKSAWDMLQPIEVENKRGRKVKEDYEQEAEIFTILDELGLEKIQSDKEKTDAEDEQGNDNDVTENGPEEQTGGTYSTATGISSIE